MNHNSPQYHSSSWDFSHEKSLPVLADDELVRLRPITPNDAEFYRNVRLQHSFIYRAAYCTAADKSDKRFFELEVLLPESFYCVIEDAASTLPIGYLGIKDTRADLWEIAIELDNQFTGQGFGARSIRLYLNEIARITGKDCFRAKVDVDNIASQKCFEKLGAELAGLCGSEILLTEDEKRRFEERNLHLIDEHIIELAKRLEIEPRQLLSHVLDYHIKCPL